SAGVPLPLPDARLLEAGVQPWADLPLWLPRETALTAWAVGTARARELGLASRPVADIVRDTWDWVRALPAGELAHELPASVSALTIRP
ncbi:hypothetical protein N867_11240, partial [Actinotalea fermentans ATCC 43279 = JCM 9966 = DSM 3133]